MRETIVREHTDNILSVTKNQHTAVVVKENGVTIITRLDRTPTGEICIMLVTNWSAENTAEFEQRWKKCCSLLTSESCESKWFANPDWEEFSSYDSLENIEEVRKIARKAIEVVERDMMVRDRNALSFY